MSATADTTYTPQEQAAYDEGREARRKGLDYFESPYMKAEGRNLYLICAWGEGYLAAEEAASVAGARRRLRPPIPAALRLLAGRQGRRAGGARPPLRGQG